jgi:hypothetical protein
MNIGTDRNTFLGLHSDSDRDCLGEALKKLLDHGSLLGLEAGDSKAYQWSYLNREILDEITALLDIKLHWDHQERTVQAVPNTSSFVLRLKLDATLVLLTLWYDFDTAVRDRGEIPPITFTAQQLNDSLAAKFQPLRKQMPSPSRLREILSLAQRKNLLRFSPDPAPDRFLIDVLPTLKRVIPFSDVEEWCKTAARYIAAARVNAVATAEDRATDTEDEGVE